jgi:hypothetical protein
MLSDLSVFWDPWHVINLGTPRVLNAPSDLSQLQKKLVVPWQSTHQAHDSVLPPQDKARVHRREPTPQASSALKRQIKARVHRREQRNHTSLDGWLLTTSNLGGQCVKTKLVSSEDRAPNTSKSTGTHCRAPSVDLLQHLLSPRGGEEELDVREVL